MGKKRLVIELLWSLGCKPSHKWGHSSSVVHWPQCLHTALPVLSTSTPVVPAHTTPGVPACAAVPFRDRSNPAPLPPPTLHKFVSLWQCLLQAVWPLRLHPAPYLTLPQAQTLPQAYTSPNIRTLPHTNSNTNLTPCLIGFNKRLMKDVLAGKDKDAVMFSDMPTGHEWDGMAHTLFSAVSNCFLLNKKNIFLF